MAPTATPALAADSTRQSETATPKEAPTEAAPLDQFQQVSAPTATLVPGTWQIGLAIIGVLSGLIAFLMYRSAKQKWK